MSFLPNGLRAVKHYRILAFRNPKVFQNPILCLTIAFSAMTREQRLRQRKTRVHLSNRKHRRIGISKNPRTISIQYRRKPVTAVPRSFPTLDLAGIRCKKTANPLVLEVGRVPRNFGNLVRKLRYPGRPVTVNSFGKKWKSVPWKTWVLVTPRARYDQQAWLSTPKHQNLLFSRRSRCFRQRKR